jgi:hypothetical protein
MPYSSGSNAAASAATIVDAARRLEEASAIFRFKSRSTAEEFDEINGQWIDSRGRNFAARHMQPQRESIEDGSKLCRAQAELIAAAQTSAGAAERESMGFLSAEQEFESAAASTREAVEACKQLVTRANSESAATGKEIAALDTAVAAAAVDPGW